MRDDFHTECPYCEKDISVNRTSSFETIPRYDDEPKSFYVSCPFCYGIFQIEILVVKTEILGATVEYSKEAKNGN
jgi:hypothetical protein